jgi:hypothetical protein
MMNVPGAFFDGSQNNGKLVLKMNVFFDKALSQICFHGKVAETTTVNNKHRDCQNC